MCGVLQMWLFGWFFYLSLATVWDSNLVAAADYLRLTHNFLGSVVMMFCCVA